MVENKKFRIERTELHTRVWIVYAPTRADALEQYGWEDEDEEHSYHSGEVNVNIEELEED